MARIDAHSDRYAELWTICAVILLSVAVACSKSTAERVPTATSNITSSTTTPPAVIDAKGPILGVSMASSLGSHGEAVNPRFTFRPEDRQLMLIVRVGKVTGSSLDITWYKTSADGDEKLFQDRIDVHDWDRAFSIGKNPSLLAVGNYKATVELEGQHVEVQFDVAAPKSGKMPPGAGAPPIAGGRGTAARPPGLAKDRYPWQQDRPDLKDCEVTTLCFSPDNDAPTVDMAAGSGCTSASGNGRGPVLVQARVGNGQPSEVPLLKSDDIVYAINPCSLDLGQDLPGTKVLFRAVARNDPSASEQCTITLGDDTLAPRLQTTSSLQRGSKVNAGDRITLDVTATEPRNSGPWQTGVKSIQVIANPGGIVGTPWTNPSNLPKACDPKTWVQHYQATYIVPRNAPAVIDLCAITEDYPGNQNSQCAHFVTGTVWKGTFHYQSSRKYVPDSDHISKYACSDSWDGTMTFIVGGQGDIVGEASTKLTEVHCTKTPPRTATSQKYSLSGKTNSNGDFEVRFTQTGSLPFHAPDVAGSMLLAGISFPGCGADSPQATVVLSKRGNDAANGHLDLNETPFASWPANCTAGHGDVCTFNGGFDVKRQSSDGIPVGKLQIERVGSAFRIAAR